MCERDVVCVDRKSQPHHVFADQLVQAVSAIQAIDDLTYRERANGTGSVGEQFRHNLDFVNAFLNGIAIGRIDYSKRARDVRVETDRRYAVGEFKSALSRINTMNRKTLNTCVSVRSEADGASWLISSVGRELEFVFSHTVHHHALIAEKLAGFGIDTVNSFGVSPSTIEHRESLAG